jgi:hypothetical protein
MPWLHIAWMTVTNILRGENTKYDVYFLSMGWDGNWPVDAHSYSTVFLLDLIGED